MQKIKDNIFWVIAGLALVIFLGFIVSNNRSEATLSKKVVSDLTGLDAFAQCLSDNGAVFYGASWCSFCAKQKEMFGDAVEFMPYVECSIAGAQGKQAPECEAKKITGYPTWIFADNSQQSGVLSFEQLSAKTGCAMP